LAVWVVKNRLDCQKCTEQIKDARGCNGFKKPQYIAEIQQEITRCPLKEVTNASRFYLDVYGHYRAGYLWMGGTVSEQPAKVMDAIGCISGLMSDIEQEEKEKAKHGKH